MTYTDTHKEPDYLAIERARQETEAAEESIKGALAVVVLFALICFAILVLGLVFGLAYRLFLWVAFAG